TGHQDVRQPVEKWRAGFQFQKLDRKQAAEKETGRPGKHHHVIVDEHTVAPEVVVAKTAERRLINADEDDKEQVVQKGALAQIHQQHQVEIGQHQNHPEIHAVKHLAANFGLVVLVNVVQVELEHERAGGFDPQQDAVTAALREIQLEQRIAGALKLCCLHLR